VYVQRVGDVEGWSQEERCVGRRERRRIGGEGRL
jgi:hypothetical protein